MPVAPLSQWFGPSDFAGRRKGVTGQSHLVLVALKKPSAGLKAPPESQNQAPVMLFLKGFWHIRPLRRRNRQPWERYFVIG